MSISKKICPVPFDQQPLNEYSSLKASCFFAWSTLEKYKYINTVFYIFCFLFILCMPFAFSIVSDNNKIIKIFILNLSIVNLVFILIFIRLYLGWSYIIKRLVSATVFYEESGWYDGQVWIKNVESLTKDRLIGLYEVIPFITRIKYSLAISVIFWLIENSVYYLI